MWGMADAFSRSPANVRDGWCVLQKPSQCEGWLMRSPEDSGCEGPADTLLILITNAHDSYHWLLLLQAIHYYSTSLLIINYCHTELCTTNYDNCFDTQRPTTPSGQQLSSTTALPLKTLIHAKTRLIFAINHRFTHCPRAYCKKLQHRYIELAKREIYWDKDNVLRIWGRNAITLQLYRKRSKLWGPDN